MMVAVMSRITIRIRRKTARERENIRIVSSARLGGSALVGLSGTSRIASSQALASVSVQQLSSLPPLGDDNDKVPNQKSVDKEEHTTGSDRPSSYAIVKHSNSGWNGQRGSMVAELVLDIA